jgi:hypothetical protein
MLAYAHPLTAGAAIVLLAYMGLLGLQQRTKPRQAAALAARHARLAPWAYGAVVAVWAAGAASTYWLRPDLEPGASLHWRIGALTVALLTGSTVTARAMRRTRPHWREWHPWFGAAALLLAAAQAVTGLQLLP